MGAPTQRQLPFSLEPALALQCPLPMPGFILPNTHTHSLTQKPLDSVQVGVSGTYVSHTKGRFQIELPDI